MIVFKQHQGFVDYINQKLGFDLDMRDCKTIADISHDGKINGVILFQRCNKHNLEITVAFERGFSVTRRLIKAAYLYAFLDVGVKRITAYVETSNKDSIAFCKRLGMKLEFETSLKNWFGDKDAMQFFILRDECKWIKDYK